MPFPAPHRAGLIEAGGRPPAGSGRRRSFRLLTEPASLKRRSGSAPTWTTTWMFPAPHRAGLIEAPAAPPSTSPRSLFPAPHRAGLIEAAPCPPSRRGRRRFPAPHRAGLIEAKRPTDGASPGSTSFRLLTEPASLKRARMSDRRGHPRGFRLLTEPASLKRRRHRRRVHQGMASFRLLTEPASLKPTPGRPPCARPRVSGSSQSRPH